MSYLQGPFLNNRYIRATIALVVLWLAILAPAHMFAQDDLNVHGVVSNAITSSKIADVMVTVKKNGSSHNTFSTRANGKYEFYLDCNASYEFIFEKSGFVTRSIIIDARNVPQEVIGAGIIMPTDMSMFEITEAMENEDLSVFNQPIGKAKFDPAQGDLVWDFTYTNKVKSEINTFMRDVEKRQKEMDKEASAAEKEAAANEAKFIKFVKDGEAAMKKDRFQDGVLNFKAALEIKPDDKAVKDLLDDAETKLTAQKAKEKLDSEYAAALDAGDGFMRTEEFQNAIDKYQEALDLKPGEKYPTDQIASATKTMEDRLANRAKQEEFDALMSEGEKLFADKKYEESLAKYTAAQKVISDNAEVAKRITDVKAAIANKEALAAQQAKYDGLIASADQNFNAEKYEAALTDYKAASALLPDEAYPAERITATEEKIAALANAAKQKQAFDKLVDEGDKAVLAAKYQIAIDKYTEALSLIADDSAVKAKLEEAKDILAENQAAAEKKEAYDALIIEADGLYKNEDLASAKSKYEEARKLIPEETYPLDQITKIDKRLKELAESEEAQKSYDAAMAAGNAAVGESKFSEGISQFEIALGIFPKDVSATAALENAKSLQKEHAANQQMQAAYEEKLASADAKMANEVFAEARADYLAAQKIKPEETYPQSQIDLIDATLAKREADAAKAAEEEALEAEFQGFITAGDKAIGKEDYAEAIARYGDALGVKPGDAIAQAKLDDAKAAQKAKQQASEINEQYAIWVKRGDDKLNEDALQDAIAAYRESLDLKSDEKYPQDQIKLIEERIAAKAEAEADAAAKAKSEQVNALILEGDNLVKEQAYENGIVKYNEALAILPDRGDIQPKIDAAMSKMLAFQEAAGIDEAYNSAIKDADIQFGQKNWQRSISGYEQALKIKSEEIYPKDQIELINIKIADEEAAAELERQQRIQAEFDGFISDGDKSFKKNRYEDALAQYEDALSLIPTSELALSKIGEVNELLGEMDKERAEQKKYDKYITEADALFDETSYEMARLKYLDAKDLKPNEKYPEKRITEIDILLEKLRLEALANEADAQDQEYRDALKNGDDLVLKKNYNEAIEAFESALEIKPDEIYPTRQIERINLLVKAKEEAEQAEKERLAAAEKAKVQKPKRSNEQLSRVNTNSEDQAEQFMRDAREAQENEKYERIKKLKAQQAENIENRELDSKAKRDAEYTRLTEMKSEAGNQFAEAKAISENKIENSRRYKEAIIQSEEIRSETQSILVRENFANIQNDAKQHSEWMSDRESQRDEEIQKQIKLKQDQLEMIREWSYASEEKRIQMNGRIQEAAAERYSENKRAEELRMENTARLKEQEDEVMEQRAALEKRNLEDIRKKTAENKADEMAWAETNSQKNENKVKAGAQQLNEEKDRYSNALKDAEMFADKRRAESAEELRKLNKSEPKAYDEYFRSHLAENYPAGVSEESSTLGNKVIITRIVVRGNKGDEYKKVLDIAGNYYFKNGQSVSEHTWNRETIQSYKNAKD